MGTVKQREDGSWWITYRTASGVEVEKSTPAVTREEAEKLLHHCELQAWAVRATGATMIPDPEPFLNVWAWWQETCLLRYSKTWQRTVSLLSKKYLLPAVGHLFAGEILPMDFQAKSQKWITDGMSPRTANVIRSIAKTIVNDARANKRWPLIENPFSLIRPRKIRRQIWPTLHKDECLALLSSAKEPWRSMWALAIFLGLRRGELFALRGEDIDLTSRAILVHRSNEREQTKNGIDRLLPFSDELWKIVGQEFSTVSPKNLVFPNRSGRRINRDFKLPARLRKDLSQAGVNVSSKFRVHDLRHTFATLATEAGVIPDVIRLTLGHAGGITASYQHIGLEVHRRELSKLSILYQQEEQMNEEKKIPQGVSAPWGNEFLRNRKEQNHFAPQVRLERTTR